MRRTPAQRRAAKQNWRKMKIKGMEAQAKILIADLGSSLDPEEAKCLLYYIGVLIFAHKLAVKEGR